MRRMILLIIATLFLSACQPIRTTTGSSQILTPTNTSARQPTNTLTPTNEPTHTLTTSPTETKTPEPTKIPTATATPLGGGTGTIIYSEGWTVYAINTNGQNRILLHENCVWNRFISPNGKYMVCSKYQEKEGLRGGFGVVLIDLDKRSVLKEFLPDILISNGGWSPDGKQFLFSGSYQEQTGILSLDTQSLKLKMFYPTDKQFYSLTWAPDGRKILLVEILEAQNANNFYVIDADGRNLILVNDSPEPMNLSLYEWGNNSDTLLIRNYDQVISLDTLQPTGEEPPSRPFSYPEGFIGGIIASPDENYEFAYDQKRNKNYLLDLRNGKLTDISEVDSNFQAGPFSAVFSPDGTQLAYFDNKRNVINLFMIDNLTNSVLVKVVRDPSSQYDYYNGAFLWLPDGKHIVYVQADDKGGFEINRIDLSGEITTLATAKWPVQIMVQPIKQ